MRTLKKTLCLVLALVMMLGLCAISASATDLPDDDKIADDYREAFEIANYLKIITGAEVGGEVVANPQGDMTRVQGCYYIARLLKGNYGTGTASMFTDVSGQDAAVVEWMVAQGYTEGNGDGTFEPYNKMLGMHFAKWLLTALGYDAEAEGLTGVGDKWEGQVRLLTAKTGLTRGITGYDQNAVLTREQAAQMVLNALEADLVEYDQTTSVNQGGLQVTITGTARSMQTTDTRNDYASNADGRSEDFIQLVEMYYPNLKKTTSRNAGVTSEELNRPVDHVWTERGTEICRVMSVPVATFTDKVKAAEVTSTMDGYYLGSNEWAFNASRPRTALSGISGVTVHVNGVVANKLNVSNSNVDVSLSTNAINVNSTSISDMIAALTGKGRLVELYATGDDPNEIDVIVITCYTVAKVDKIKTDSKKGETTYTFKNVVGDNSFTVTAMTYDDTPNENTMIADAALAEGDIVILTSSDENKMMKGMDSSKVFVYLAEKHTGTQSSYTSSSAKVKIDGKDYEIATAVYADGETTPTVLKDDQFTANKEVDFYLDPCGYVVYAKAVEKDESTGNYAFIVQAKGKLNPAAFDGDVQTPKIEVRAVLSDGTWGDYEVATELVDITKTVNGTKNDVHYRYYPSNGSSYSKNSTKFEENYYIISGTDIIVASADGETATDGGITWVANTADGICVDNAAKLLMSDLYGYVYEYTLDGKVLTLKPLGEKNVFSGSPAERYGNNYLAGDRKVGTTYTGQTTGMILKGVQSYESAVNAHDSNNKFIKPANQGTTASSNAVSVIVGASTKFVIFNSTTQKVEVQTGLSKMPSEIGGDNNKTSYGYYVAKATTATRLNADLVFITNDGGVGATPAPSKDYVFINGKALRTEGNGDDVKYFYTAITKDGSSFEVFAKEEQTAGLYDLKNETEINKQLFKAGTEGTSITEEAHWFYLKNIDDGSHIERDGKIDSKNTSGNKTWTLGDAKTYGGGSIDTDNLIVVLKLDNAGDLTTDIEVVFAWR